VERLSRFLVLALATSSGCSAPTYSDAGTDGAAEQAETDDASAIIAPDGGRGRSDARVQGGEDADDGGEELIRLPDAEAPTETAPDGGQVPLVSGVPEWAAPLLGRYATRTVSFAQDNFGTRIRTREYALVDFVATTGADPHVELKLKVCDSFGDGDTAETRVTWPDFLTQRTHRVLFGGRSWATQAPDTTDGFTRALPARCEGKEGSEVAKDPGQTWIAGATCRCPSSIDVAPTREDCRVVDQDQDGKPGTTVHLHPKMFLGDADLHAASINRNTFVKGTVGSGRHTSELQVDQIAFQLSCEPVGCADVAETPAPCPPSRNKAEFVRVGEPLDGSYDCAKVIANAATTFPSALPTYPPSCP
jgi:hypothetical protein